jgi:preprotein translocase subunit YajC
LAHVKTWLPLLVVVLVLGGLLLYSTNARRKQMAKEMVAQAAISVGTEVMTTSGLYGTVVGLNPDATVQLSITPGVEVKWALAALRDVRTLPERYQRDPAGGSAADPDSA